MDTLLSQYSRLRQFNYKYGFGYAEWSDDQQRIRIGVAVKPFQRDLDSPLRSYEDLLTADACTDLLHDVKAGLFSAATALDNPILLILHWFGHRGGRLGGVQTRPPGQAEIVQYPAALAPDQIVAITNIEVNISSYGFVAGGGTDPDLACSQGLNGGPATIHDRREKK